jgi:hypothetical protein
MNSKLNASIESLVNEYLQATYKVSLTSLLECYKTVRNESKPCEVDDEDIPVPSPQKVEKKSINEVLKKGSKSTNKNKCIHPIAKGDKKGQPCGVSVSDESKSGNYCKKHLGQESKEDTSSTHSVRATSLPKKEEKKPVSKGKKEEVILTKQELKEQIEKRTQEVEVRRNKFGNWEHYGSHIVLDRNTRKAIGKQQDDGTIAPLTKEDIEICKTVGFKYVIPDNMSSEENVETVEDEEDEDLDVEDEDLDEEMDD